MKRLICIKLKMDKWAIIVAGGSGTRMGLGRNKTLERIGNCTVLERAAKPFRALMDGICVVTRKQDIDIVRTLQIADTVVAGGETRQESVFAGLSSLPESADVVLVHDAARPFVSERVIRDCIKSVELYGSGVAAVRSYDTVKKADARGVVTETIDRTDLWMIQTPQGFMRSQLFAALEKVRKDGVVLTDDASAMEYCGYRVHISMGDPQNIKLTTLNDLEFARLLAMKGAEDRTEIRVGHGYDVHRLVSGRKLILCGIEIPFEKGLLGHSDADVAIHALIDAMLGAAVLGNIGQHFPDSDDTYKGISSGILLKKTLGLLRQNGFALCNADITITAQRPKLQPYIEAMRSELAETLETDIHALSIKATTSEGLGFEGEGLGISAHAVVLLSENRPV